MDNEDSKEVGKLLDAVAAYMGVRGADVMFDSRKPAESMTSYARRNVPKPVDIRPRASARRRRVRRSHRRAQSPSRGDPEPGSQLLAALYEDGGELPLDILRAHALVALGWSDRRYRGELAGALKRDLIDVGYVDDYPEPIAWAVV